MKKGDFLWSAYRITEKQKAGKARNIKEKQLKNSRNTVSRKQEEQASSRRDNLRTAEDNGNLEISGFLTDWIVMKIADFRFVTNMLLTNRCRCDYVIQRCIL